MKSRRGYEMNRHLVKCIIDVMTNPMHDGKSITALAKILGIHESTLRSYLTEDVWKIIEGKRLTVVFDQLDRVDSAVYAKAVEGDMAAAKLIYTRWREQQKDLEDKNKKNEEELDVLDEEVRKLRTEIATLERRYSSVVSEEKTAKKEERSS